MAENSANGDSQNFEFTFSHIHAAEPEDDDYASLSSSVCAFPEQHGRTYHAYHQGSYVFPNDDLENQRLEFQNEILNNKIFQGRQFLSPWTPNNPPKRVLDVGTGTGDWVIDFSDQFPTALVTGIDLSPIQTNFVPPNVRFYVQDASEEWLFSTPFDYIYTRCLLGSFADFKQDIVKQAFENLEPGGYFESCDIMFMFQSDDGTLSPDTALYRWCHDMERASDLINRPLTVADRIKTWYEEIGFEDVQEVIVKVPTSPWPQDPHWKEIGALWRDNILMGLSGFTLWLFHEGLGQNKEEIELALIDVRKDLQDTKIHSYQNIHVVWGRKPLHAERSR